MTDPTGAGARAGAGVHPIEAQSYAIMASRVDLSSWPPGARDVVARMIHATADESFAETARIGDQAIDAAIDALGNNAPIICDAHRVVAGVPNIARRTDVHCYLDAITEVAVGATRSAAAIAAAAADHPAGAIWVIGNAPTALAELLRLHHAGRLRPAAVIGVPVGYVGAAEAKAALWDSALRALSITNTGRRGGSPVAAAVLNAVQRLAPAGQSAPR
jgi:precorrin-8X/cobalt-precorrin-8 methylmutase